MGFKAFRSVAFAVAALLTTAFPQNAPAQPFADDFESGTMLTTDAPAGQWDALNTALNFTSSASAAAAHRGAFGYRVIDSSSATGNGENLDHNITTTTGNFYVRFWYRLVSSNGLGSAYPAQLDNSDGHTVLDWMEIFNSNQQETAGEDNVGYTEDPRAQGFDVGAWHLVELKAMGVGTANGLRQMAIDGILSSASTALNLTTRTTNQFELGEPYSDVGTFQGIQDFDDFRMDTSPLASHFGISTVATANSGDCVPVTVSLLNSFDSSESAAPYPLTPALSVNGVAGEFFLDSGCQTANATTTLSAGDTHTTTYFKATASGPAVLTVSHVDFLSGSLPLTLSEPTQTPIPSQPDLGRYGIGCGCQAGAGFSFPWIAVAVLAWLSRWKGNGYEFAVRCVGSRNHVGGVHRPGCHRQSSGSGGGEC